MSLAHALWVILFVLLVVLVFSVFLPVVRSRRKRRTPPVLPLVVPAVGDEDRNWLGGIFHRTSGRSGPFVTQPAGKLLVLFVVAAAIVVVSIMPTAFTKTTASTKSAAPTGSIVPTALPTAAGAPPMVTGVHVSGNHLVDATGDVLQLRGVNVSGTEFACIQQGAYNKRGWSIYGNQPLDQANTYAAMQAWHVHAVRVPLNEDCWLGINGVNPAYGGGAYQRAIRSQVDAINRAGMVAILELHFSAPGAYAAYQQQPMADADHSIAFWQSVAAYFKDNHQTIFGLYNEPFFYTSYIADSTDPWTCWLKGCQLNQFLSGGELDPNGRATGYTTNYSWRAAGMQQLVDAVRGTGATQPLIINGLGWGGDDSGWLAHAPSDPLHQIIAGAHLYPPQGCPSSCIVPYGTWEVVFTPIAQKYPVLIGETGGQTAPPTPFLPRFLSYADTHGWSYLAWCWNPFPGYKSYVLITDWQGTPNSGEGTVFKTHLMQYP